jgi:hypothetical protein
MVTELTLPTFKYCQSSGMGNPNKLKRPLLWLLDRLRRHDLACHFARLGRGVTETHEPPYSVARHIFLDSLQQR